MVTQLPPTHASPAPQAGEHAVLGQAGLWAVAVADPPGVVQVVAAPANRIAKAASIFPGKNCWTWPRPAGAGVKVFSAPTVTRKRSRLSLKYPNSAR
jgi:hypothetical protein